LLMTSAPSSGAGCGCRGIFAVFSIQYSVFSFQFLAQGEIETYLNILKRAGALRSAIPSDPGGLASYVSLFFTEY